MAIAMAGNPADAENDALSAALTWLKDAPTDDRLQDVSFGRYTDGSGCWWSMQLCTEVRNGEVQASPEDYERKQLKIITAWREAFLGAGS